jgi:hypothetical protein
VGPVWINHQPYHLTSLKVGDTVQVIYKWDFITPDASQITVVKRRAG